MQPKEVQDEGGKRCGELKVRMEEKDEGGRRRFRKRGGWKGRMKGDEEGLGRGEDGREG